MADPTGPFRYRAFGGVLESGIAFPELPSAAAGDAADWVLVLDHGPGGVEEGWTRLGDAPVEAGVDSVLWRRDRDGALRLVYDDTGTFEISPDGRRIVWLAPEDVDVDRGRRDVLGRVFALAFHQAGVVTLHGSAVAIGRRGVCFLAPKYHGKSTTAAALVDAGGLLLADDLVVLAPGPDGATYLLPTLATVNLWPDAAERVGRRAEGADEMPGGAKVQMRFGAADSPVRLDGVYLLAPAEDADAEVIRTLLEPRLAAMALLGQHKVAELLGPFAVLDLLPDATTLAGRVGVHRLVVPRALDRLPDLVGRLLEWHAEGGA